MSNINLSQYQQLCLFFDKILLNKQTDKTIIANTWLHILREHPVFLKPYYFLYHPLPIGQKIKQNLLNLGRFSAISIIRISQSIFNQKYWYSNNKQKPLEVLFISHLTNYYQIGQTKDAYFGDISKQLLNKNITSGIALINHINISNSRQIQVWNESFIPRFVLSKTLSFFKEIRLYFSQICSIITLKKVIKQTTVPKEFAQPTLIHTLSSDTANALRIAQQITYLITQMRPKCVVFSYEGHAWERLVCDGINKINPNIACIGYQHAAIFAHQHALIRPLASNYNPDIILTSGKVSKEQLCSITALSKTKIACLGSPKSEQITQLSQVNLATCLVVPEGFVSECLLLFEFSLLCAKTLPKQQFIWRLHPLISFNQLKKHSKIFNHLPNNITLSGQKLNADIAKCDSVLYRGSTAVVNAINAGLKPIYYQTHKDEMSIDPIYQHNEGKFMVNQISDFKDALETPINLQTQTLLANFAQDFYTPLDVKVLIDLIK